jgi:hypothetical protein
MSDELPHEPAPPVPPARAARRNPLWFQFGLPLLVIAILVFGLLLPAVDRTREAAARAMCNLGQVAFALQNYQEVHGAFPPAVLRARDGRPLHSWRVLLLPYIEEAGLHSKFRLDEPWDSPHNIRLLDRMPRTYRAPWERYVDVPPDHTVLKVFTGKGTLFEEGLRTRVADATPETLLFVEAGDPIPWTKPEDVPYDPADPPWLRGLFRDGFRSCVVGGSYRFVTYGEADTVLRTAVLRAGPGAGPRVEDGSSER